MLKYPLKLVLSDIYIVAMIITNYHTHTNFCDGIEPPQAYAEEAVNRNLRALGFSAHAPMPFPCSWALPYGKYSRYLDTIQALKESYSEKIEIYCGLEVDYLPDLWPAMKRQLNLSQLDYYLGSIHFIDSFDDGTRWTIDGSNEEFRKGWAQIFDYNSHAVIQKFFEYTRRMVQEMNPPVIGHLDKIKMQYQPDCLIPNTDPFYQKELLQTLDVIAEASSIIEVNTRGMYRRHEPDLYPGFWVLEAMAKRNIPVMINSDAHRPEEVDQLFIFAATQLRKVGYRAIQYFSKGEWRECGI
jgi:histidinol-phosphatase (PHP family)